MVRVHLRSGLAALLFAIGLAWSLPAQATPFTLPAIWGTSPGGGDLPPGEGAFTVRALPHDSDGLLFEVDADRPGLLVISTTFHPGWTATVDGQPARLYRTNYTSMGLSFLPGKVRSCSNSRHRGFGLARP